MTALAERVTALRERRKPVPVSEWFRVRWDAAAVYLIARPPGGESWTTAIPWSAVTRVCFKAEGFAASDGILLFTSGRDAAWAVPIEARGGEGLWGELVRRGLFDARLAFAAMKAEEGVFCWPPADSPAPAIRRKKRRR